MAQTPDPDPAPLEVHARRATLASGILPNVDLPTVLAAEFEALHGPPQKPIVTESDYAREVHGKPGRIAALCLSGGGIRSASFALGMLQSLAQHGLLTQFHYLSTVSGGGYIASCYSWLRARLKAGNNARVFGAPLADGGGSVLDWIRRHGKYLVSHRGFTILVHVDVVVDRDFEIVVERTAHLARKAFDHFKRRAQVGRSLTGGHPAVAEPRDAPIAGLHVGH